MAKIQITGGGFQDSEGNILANGYLEMVLSQDCQVAATAQVCSGITVKVPLDASGNVLGTVLVWPNDQLLPVNNFYTVKAFTPQGQTAWGPNVQQIIGAGPFSLNSWVPNQIVSWVPSVASIALQTNGVKNGSQVKLNVVAGSNVTVTDDGSGDVTIASTTTTPLSLQTNEVANGSQALLDLHAGSGITLVDNGSGRVTITAPAAPAGPASLAQPQDNVWFMWTPQTIGTGVVVNAVNDVIVALQDYSTITRGTFAPTSTSGLWMQAGASYSSDVINRFNASFGREGQPRTWIGRNTTFETRLFPINSSVPSITNLRIWAGLYDSTGTGGRSAFVFTGTPTAFKVIAFLYDPSIDSHWQCVCGDGAAITSVVTTVSVVAGTSNKLKWVYTASGPSVQFFIDGTLVATISTHIPSNVAVSAIMSATSMANTSNDAGMGWEYVYSDNASL